MGAIILDGFLMVTAARRSWEAWLSSVIMGTLRVSGDGGQLGITCLRAYVVLLLFQFSLPGCLLCARLLTESTEGHAVLPGPLEGTQ